jgi:hypothetical protein
MGPAGGTGRLANPRPLLFGRKLALFGALGPAFVVTPGGVCLDAFPGNWLRLTPASKVREWGFGPRFWTNIGDQFG